MTIGHILEPGTVVAQDLAYARCGRTLLRGVDITVAPGESVAVVGYGEDADAPAALVRILSGLALPDSGWVDWGGRDLVRLRDAERSVLRRRDVGVLLDRSGLVPGLAVSESIALPLLLDGVPRRAAVGAAADLLDLIGLTGLGARRVDDLDAARQMLVLAGRALVTGPRLVAMQDPDLPTAAAMQVLDVVLGLCARRGAALVLATGDERRAARCSRRIEIVDGRSRVRRMQEAS